MSKRSIAFAWPLATCVVVSACGGVVNQRGRQGTDEGGAGGGSTIVPVDVGNGGAPDYGSGGTRPWLGTGGTPSYAGSASGGYPEYGGSPPSGGGPPGGASSVYRCVSTYGSDPGGSLPAGAACASTVSGSYGQCRSTTQAASDPQHALFGHGACTSPLVCANDPYANDGGPPVWTVCTTTAGSGISQEGRCIPKGLAIVPTTTTRVTQASCPTDFRCIPCYDPVNAQATGACVGAGAPTNPPPAPLRRCGTLDGGPAGGYCVQQNEVSRWGQPLSQHQDECAVGEVCVPALTVERPNDCFSPCTTTLATLGTQYGPGACVPAFVVRDLSPSGLSILTQGGCQTGELCSPCLDPLNSGAPTGACEPAL